MLEYSNKLQGLYQDLSEEEKMRVNASISECTDLNDVDENLEAGYRLGEQNSPAFYWDYYESENDNEIRIFLTAESEEKACTLLKHFAKE